MTYLDNVPLPPGHNRAELLDLDFPKLGLPTPPEGTALSIVAPIVYGWPSSTAVVLPCDACRQPCYVSVRALGVKLIRLCWDCVDDQVPGFVERKLAEA